MQKVLLSYTGEILDVNGTGHKIQFWFQRGMEYLLNVTIHDWT